MRIVREHPVHQENDRIHGVLVFLILSATALFIVLCAWVAWLLWHTDQAAFHPGGLPKIVKQEVTSPQIWGVNQTLIDFDTAAATLDGEKRKLLTEYGWIDSVQGIARIPIKAAMRAVVLEGGAP